jgi:hypothetical protein
MEEEIRDTDWKSRISSLDNSFLFLISSVTVVFTVIQAFVSSGVAFLLFMPLLFSGLFYPFYAGYLRGAVEGSMIGRIRGWICFIVGTATYVAYIGIVFSRDFLVSGEATFLNYAVALLLGYVVSKRVYRWLVSITGSRLSGVDVFSISGAATSASILSFGLIMMESILRYWLSPPAAKEPVIPTFSDVWLILTCLLIFVFVEKISRQLPSIPRDSLESLQPTWLFRAHWIEDFRGTPTLAKPIHAAIFSVFLGLWYNRRLRLCLVAFVICCLAYGVLSPFWISGVVSPFWITILQTTAGVLSVVLESCMIVVGATMPIRPR